MKRGRESTGAKGQAGGSEGQKEVHLTNDSQREPMKKKKKKESHVQMLTQCQTSLQLQACVMHSTPLITMQSDAQTVHICTKPCQAKP